MKILLFGSKGQIGRELVELAANKNISTFNFDIDSVDITDAIQVARAFAIDNAIDVVINAAAYTAVENAEAEPTKAFAVNADGVKILSLECQKHHIPLLHISTDYVFSGEKNAPYTEDDLAMPLGVYGKSKLKGETLLRTTWEQHIILRVSWVFGKYGKNFVKTMLQLAQKKQPINVVNDQFGCPTAAADVARVLLELAEKIVNGKRLWGIYHYSGKPAVSWYQFATKIIDQKINATTTKEFPTIAPRPKNSELAVEKITKTFGIVRHGWEEYLQRVIAEI